MGKIAEVKFVGSNERLRLEMSAMETLASAQRPGAPTFTIEAVRTASDVDAMPLSIGQKVYVGFKHMHALPTPISSLRLVASGGRSADNICPHAARAAARGAHAHRAALLRLTSRTCPSTSAGCRSWRPTPTASIATALDLLARGARQVLMLASPEPRIERMLIYVEPSSFGRDSVLAAAASLARHLPIDVGMLVRDEEDDGYRDLLDLRNESLQQHGLDIRTETFRGNATDAVRERLVTSDEQTLLVVGLSAPERCSDLVEDLQKLLREQPPAAVLFVSGRDTDANAVAAVRCGFLALSMEIDDDAQSRIGGSRAALGLRLGRAGRPSRRAATLERVVRPDARALSRAQRASSSRNGSPTPASKSRCRCRTAARAAKRAPSSTA